MKLRNVSVVLCLAIVPGSLADSKVKMKTTAEGHAFESTSYIQGQRFRDENSFQMMGASLATIRQCDLKRTIQLNDKNKSYMIIPDSEPGEIAKTEPAPKPAPRAESEPAEPTRHGGTVTITTNVKDTGERKQMFGHTARHVIATMTTETTPNACRPGKSSIEIDGWYIDFNPGQQSCVKPEQQVLDVLKPTMPTAPVRGRTSGGCEDDYKFQGSGFSAFQKLGFAVQTTMTMSGSEGKNVTFTREAEEVSSTPLDAALFEIPEGYKQVNSMAALMGINAGSVMGAMLRGGARNQTPIASGSGSSSTDASGPKAGRVCVAPVQDNSGRSLNTTALQQRTATEMQNGGVSAVAAADGCPYTLTLNITSAKEASAAKKIGGLLGRRAAGIGGGGDSGAEASVSYQVVRAGDHSVVASGTADGKGGSADDAAAQAIGKAMQQAAGKVPQQ